LPPHIAGSLDAIMSATEVAGKAIATWNPACANLQTYLTPRVIGAMLRYAGKQRQAGLTGAVTDVILLDLDGAAAYEDDYSDGPHPGMAARERIPLSETLAYDPPPEGLEEPPDGARRLQGLEVAARVGQLPDQERIALERFYGLPAGADEDSMRQIALKLGLSHPQQSARLLRKAQKNLLDRVTKGKK
jgi:hypothetical protein